MPEKIIKVKGTSKRVAHKRKIKISNKKEKIKLRDGINNIDIITKNNDDKIDKILKFGDWNSFESKFFNMPSKCHDCIIHSKNNKIYAISKLQPIGQSVHIALLEVNPSQRREGYGINAMKDIINTIINSEIYNKIELTSLGDDSDKFYIAIGMKQTNPEKDEQFKYKGDKQWMKKFMKSI